MRVLFTSDIHGRKDAWQAYAGLLADEAFDFGIIAGDLTDDFLTIDTIREASGAVEDELLEELYDPEDSVEDLEERVKAYKSDPTTPLARAVKHFELEIKEILSSAEKHIFLVPGNHDLSDWDDTELITNVHGKRVEIGGYNIVGYRYTDLELDQPQQRRDVRKLRPLVDRRTILVTHSPCYGTLDRNYRGISIGSRALCRLVRKCPAYHLFGHIHASFGIEGNSANGSCPGGKSFIAVDPDAGTLRIIEPGAEYGVERINE